MKCLRSQGLIDRIIKVDDGADENRFEDLVMGTSGFHVKTFNLLRYEVFPTKRRGVRDLRSVKELKILLWKMKDKTEKH